MIDLIYNQGGEKFRVHLNQGAAIIGRAMTCDVIITEKSISSEHARIVLIGESITITDLDSSNGTIVNRKKVKSATLKFGDKIKLGRVSVWLEGLKPDSSEAARTIDPLKVYKTPADGSRPDPALLGMGRRKRQLHREKKSGLSSNLKLLFYLLILALIGFGAYATIHKGNSGDPENPVLIIPEYSSEAYHKGLLAGIAEFENYNFSAAYTLWKETDDSQKAADPDAQDETAATLALLTQPLAKAQAENSYLGINWYIFEQKAKIFLIETPEVPEEVISFLDKFSQEAAKEDKTLGILKEALTLYDKGEYLKAIETAEKLPASRYYSKEAIALIGKAKAVQREKLTNNVNLYAEAEDWDKAIELAIEILKETESPELQNNIKKWRLIQSQQAIIDEAKKLIANKTREDIVKAQRLLEEIPEDSRFYQQARGDILNIQQQILSLTVEEFWSEANTEALNNLARDNPTLKNDPRYLNIMKIADETSILLAEAEELVEKGNLEAATEAWADVCRIIPDQDHRYYQQASSRLAYYTDDKFGELYRNQALAAMGKSDHKAARLLLDKAKQYGAEVDAEINVLTNIARQLFNKSMNAADEEITLLENARDCLIPSDSLYQRIQKRIINIQGAQP